MKSRDPPEFSQTFTSVCNKSKICERGREFHLPCGCISPEIGKLPREPVVDLIESQLSIWGLQNGLKVRERETTNLARERERECRRRDEAGNLMAGGTYMTYEGGVSEGRPDISVLVELAVLSKLWKK